MFFMISLTYFASHRGRENFMNSSFKRWKISERYLIAFKVVKNITFSGWSKTCLHCNGDQKKIWWKKHFSSKFLTQNSHFSWHLKRSQPSELSFTCLYLIEIRLWNLFTVFRCCKTCAYWIKEHKKFLLKQKFSSKFLTQIWHFPWSHYVKSSLRDNFECQNFFRP